MFNNPLETEPMRSVLNSYTVKWKGCWLAVEVDTEWIKGKYKNPKDQIELQLWAAMGPNIAIDAGSRENVFSMVEEDPHITTFETHNLHHARAGSQRDICS